jgi:hypothetical protein
MRLALLIALTFNLLPLSASWVTYSEFATEYAESTKPSLLFFTDASRDGWGMKFENEVLTHQDFSERVSEAFVCVKVDLSEKSIASKEEKDSLKRQFDVTTLPTLVLLDQERRIVKKFPYTSLQPKQFADDLFYTLAQGRDLRSLEQKLKQGVINEHELEQLFALAQDLGELHALFAMAHYSVEHPVSPALLVDLLRISLNHEKTECMASLKAKLKESGSMEYIEQAALSEYQYLEAKYPNSTRSAAPLKAFLAEHPDHQGWQVEMVLSQHCLDHDQWEEAQELAQCAAQHAPEERVSDIQYTISYIQGLKELAQK